VLENRKMMLVNVCGFYFPFFFYLTDFTLILFYLKDFISDFHFI